MGHVQRSSGKSEVQTTFKMVVVKKTEFAISLIDSAASDVELNFSLK
jgi:hypothetical protein